jgi:hypothetical protein
MNDNIPQDEMVVAITQEAHTIQDEVKALEIKDEDAARQGAEFLTQIKTAIDELENRRKFFTKPLYDQQRNINSLFKTYREPLDEMDKILRVKIAGWNKLQKQKQEEEVKKLVAETGAGVEEVTDMLTVDKTIRASGGTVRTRKVLKWEITDKTKIPSKYFVFDPKLVTRDVKAGITEIPGINIYEDEETVVRT